VTLSLDGQVIGSARLRGLGRERIATYSVKDHEWNEYAEVLNLWSVSVSADGDKIAYVAQERQDSAALFVLDRKSGKVQKLATSAVSVYSTPSWSPDGKRIVYQGDVPNNDPERDLRAYRLMIVDTESGNSVQLVEGQAPAWSPSGEWIAYVNTTGLANAGTVVMKIRPDGTRASQVLGPSRTLMGSTKLYAQAPVWSPDSSRLLLNEVSDWDRWTMNVILLDLKTQKKSTLRKGGPPVLG